MKTKFALILVLSVFISVFSIEARGYDRHSHNQSRNCYFKGHLSISHIPNLTPKQKQKIERICYDRDKRIKGLEMRKREYNEQLYRLQWSRHNRKPQIDRLKSDMYKLDREIKRVNDNADSKIYSVLNRSQRQWILYV